MMSQDSGKKKTNIRNKKKTCWALKTQNKYPQVDGAMGGSEKMVFSEKKKNLI